MNAAYVIAGASLAGAKAAARLAEPNVPLEEFG